MAFKLLLATYVNGLEQQAAAELATLKYFATLTAPITETVMRAGLEASQFQAFSNVGWNGFLANIAAIGLDETALTTSEISIMNVIRASVMPDPSLDCCGVVVPSSSNTSLSVQPLVGDAATFQHTIEVKMGSTTDCNVKSVDVTLVGTPPTLPTPTIKCLFDRCTTSGRSFKYYNTTYASNPTGEVYTVNVDCKDANDASIVSFSLANITFP